MLLHGSTKISPKAPPGRPHPEAPKFVLITLCASYAKKERTSHNMHHSGCEHAQLLYQSSQKSNKYNTIDNLTGSFIHVKIELLCLHVRHYTNRQVQFACYFPDQQQTSALMLQRIYFKRTGAPPGSYNHGKRQPHF